MFSQDFTGCCERYRLHPDHPNVRSFNTEDSSLPLHPDRHSGKWLIPLSFTILFKKKNLSGINCNFPLRLRSRRVPVLIICLFCNFEKIYANVPFFPTFGRIPVSISKMLQYLHISCFTSHCSPPSPLPPPPFLSSLFSNLQ